MTNELEKQFFSTFGIEPIGCNDNKNCTGVLDCTQCPNSKYPQISDHILLELIFILTTLLDTTIYEDVFITVAKNREELKKIYFKNVCFINNILNTKYAHYLRRGKMDKEEIIARLDVLFEHLKKYPYSQAISDGIDKYLEMLEDEE